MRPTSPFSLLPLALLLACGPGGGADTGASTAGSTTGATTEPGSGTVDPTTAGPSTGTSTSPTTTEPATTGTTTDPGTTTGPGTTTTDTGTAETGTSETGTTDDTGPVGEAECEVDADCKLGTDCCDCDALPVGEREEICDERCDQPRCDQFGITEAVCRFGVCIAAKKTCDPLFVVCDALPPDCPEGQAAETKDGCWTGGCLPGKHCDVVPTCAACPDDWMCVAHEAQLTTLRCEPVPGECAGIVDCGCAGEFACTEPFTACAPPKSGNDLHCACPVC